MSIRNLKVYLFLIIPVCYLFLNRCDKSTNPAENNVQREIVTNNIMEIATFEEISELKKGTMMILRINREGFVVHEYEIIFEGVYEIGEERLIICRTPKEIVIGSGDSGSPIFTKEGRIAGALCYGFTGTNNQFMARAIEDLLSLGESSNNTISKHTSVQNESYVFEPLKPSYFIIGYDDKYARYYTGRNEYNPFSDYNKVPGEYLNKSSLKKHGMNTGFTQDTLLIPGMSIAVLQVYGDLIVAGAVGTASYINDNHEIFAFGHEFSGSTEYGPVAAPCVIADMKTMIESSYRSQKLAVPSTVQIGSLIRDDFLGILVDENTTPLTFPVLTSINIDSTGVQKFSHVVSNDKSYSENYYLAGYVSTYPVYRELMRRGIMTAVARGMIRIFLENTDLNSTFEVNSTGQPVSYEIWDIVDYLLQSRSESVTEVELSVEIESAM